MTLSPVTQTGCERLCWRPVAEAFLGRVVEPLADLAQVAVG
jgi:hypothetical protein